MRNPTKSILCIYIQFSISYSYLRGEGGGTGPKPSGPGSSAKSKMLITGNQRPSTEPKHPPPPVWKAWQVHAEDFFFIQSHHAKKRGVHANTRAKRILVYSRCRRGRGGGGISIQKLDKVVSSGSWVHERTLVMCICIFFSPLSYQFIDTDFHTFLVKKE